MKLLPFVGLALLALLTSCAPVTIFSNVTRFHTLPQHGSGQTFAITGSQMDGSDVELATHSSRIAGHLTRYGWVRAATNAMADYKVSFRYSHLGSNEAVASVEYNVYSYTVHKRFLEILISDKHARTVFDGKVYSDGSNQNVNAVLPQMIDSLFTGFPGVSGKNAIIRKKFE